MIITEDVFEYSGDGIDLMLIPLHSVGILKLGSSSPFSVEPFLYVVAKIAIDVARIVIPIHTQIFLVLQRDDVICFMFFDMGLF